MDITNATTTVSRKDSINWPIEAKAEDIFCVEVILCSEGFSYILADIKNFNSQSINTNRNRLIMQC